MRYTRHINQRALVLVQLVVILALGCRLMLANTGTCNGAMTTLPFTDVQASNLFFCAIAQAYFTGLTNGTSATTYNPSQSVPREQMAAFITRTQDSALKRGSRRAAVNQWYTPTSAGALGSVAIVENTFAVGIACDGEDVWLSYFSGAVKRVHASDGKLLQTWTGATGAQGLVVAAGRIFIAAYQSSSGKIYVIDPAATPGTVSLFENDLGVGASCITFDGTYLWTGNLFGSISRIDISTGVDRTFTAGFAQPVDILWDGASLWVLDNTDSHLKRINTSNGTVLESIPVIESPRKLLFDGTNIWVSGGFNTPSNITIVRAVGGLRGTVLATLSVGVAPLGMAFDGERVLLCDPPGHSVFLFKAADFTPLGTLQTGAGTAPRLACSDGLNFWIAGADGNDLKRF